MYSVTRDILGCDLFVMSSSAPRVLLMVSAQSPNFRNRQEKRNRNIRYLISLNFRTAAHADPAKRGALHHLSSFFSFFNQMSSTNERCCILNLPTCILGDILSEWSDLRALVRLDSAYCCIASRRSFFNALRCNELVLPNSTPTKSSSHNRMLEWMAERGVKTKRLDLSCDLGSRCTAYRRFFFATGSHLVVLTIKDQGSSVNSTIHHATVFCERIRALSLEDCAEIDHYHSAAFLDKFAHSVQGFRIQGGSASEILSSGPLPALRYLHIIGDSLIATNIVGRLLQYCPSLISFLASNLGGSDSCLQSLATHCPHLKVLGYNNAGPDATGLIAVLQACHGVQVIDFGIETNDHSDESQRFTAEHLQAVAQYCSQLRAFRYLGINGHYTYQDCVQDILLIASSRKLTHLSVLYAPCYDGLFEGLVRYCNSITHLALNPRRGEVPQEAVLTLFRHLPSLQVLDADYSDYWLSDAALQALAEGSPQLTEVHLSGVSGVTQEGVLHLAKGCAALRTVYVEDAHSVFPRALRQRMQQLRPALRFVEKLDYPAPGVGFWWDLPDVTREVEITW